MLGCVLGNHGIGIKYPKPCVVIFAAIRNQKDLFLTHEQWVDPKPGPRIRDLGSLPLTNGNNGTRKQATPIERIRRVFGGPYACRTLGRMSGRTRPPVAVLGKRLCI
jgi:hypothetical protein